MRKFTKQETFIVILTLFLIFMGTAVNLVKALSRARDAQRKVDLGIISNNLNSFHEDYGFFPASDNGRIVVCKNENFEEVYKELSQLKGLDLKLLYKGLRPCVWGVDPLADILGNSKPYMDTLPSDPKTSDGFSYYYISNGGRYQIYTYLEGGPAEVGYDQKIVERGLMCGKGICSFGKAYGDTPVTKSIEEYEQELLLKTKLTN